MTHSILARQRTKGPGVASSGSIYENQRGAGARSYQIDFALTVLVGNLTRYLALRPVVDADATIRARWYPIRTWVAGDWLRVLPANLRIRGRHLLDSVGLFLHSSPDAAVVHHFDIYTLYAFLHWLFRTRTVVVTNQDGEIEPCAPGLRGLPRRLALRSTDLFIFWSTNARDVSLGFHPSLPAGRIRILHPGIDLNQWPLRPPVQAGPRFRLLFVGGNLIHKGIYTLLDAFDGSLAEHCDLDIASQSAYLPDELRTRIESTAHCTLHLDLVPFSSELQRLYQQSDAFVLPTKAEHSPWVLLEAMATGLPVVTTPVGGIPEIVLDDQTGLLVPVGNPGALAAAIERLRTDPHLRQRLVRNARAHVEACFDFSKNTDQFLGWVKDLVDQRLAHTRLR